MFMTQDEIEMLTGYKVHACQIRWLTNNNWIHTRAANGRPIVLRAHAESKLSAIEQKPVWSPNVASLKKRA